MKEITNYDQITISRLQYMRLYLQGRPLLQFWADRRRERKRLVPLAIQLIEEELDGDYIAIDCAGWYFSNSTRDCVAIELSDISSRFWNSIHYEYDYLTWHPTYLDALPVLAYYSTYFKYSTISDFLTFCKIWSENHSKVIIGLDPTKVKFNYLKYSLLSVIKESLPDRSIRIITDDYFDLLFVIEHK